MNYRTALWFWAVSVLFISSFCAFVMFSVDNAEQWRSQPERLNPADSGSASTELVSSSLTEQGKLQIVAAYGKLPLSFEANRGQTDRRVNFLSRGSGYGLLLTDKEAVLALRKPRGSTGKPRAAMLGISAPGQMGGADLFARSAVFSEFFQRLPVEPTRRSAQLTATRDKGRSTDVLRMKLVGANTAANVVGVDELPGKSNYFLGDVRENWRTNVPNYAKVKYQGVYPGVDLVYYGNQRQLEYDFVVAPGADPSRIALDIERGVIPERGHQGLALHVAEDGDLVVQTETGDVRFRKPIVYQPAAGSERRMRNTAVDGRYILSVNHEIRFQLANYDKHRPVIIDPVLSYSTYLGGSGDESGSGIAVDSGGSAYVTGGASAIGLPTANPVQASYAGGSCSWGDACGDAFVVKLNASGTAVMFSTYLGGSGGDAASGIALDSRNNVYLTGTTNSTDFPTTLGAFRTRLAGNTDAFVTKLDGEGSALVYSTYLGGTGSENNRAPYASEGGIAVDAAGNAYVTGETNSTDFPTTPGAFQTALGSSDGGSDAFITKLNASGSALAYSTYLGGSGVDFCSAIAVDAAGNAYVTGTNYRGAFPTTLGALQSNSSGGVIGVVAKLNAAGSALIYSTYLGGTAWTESSGIAVDADGNAYVTGQTAPYPPMTAAFVSKLNATGSRLTYSAYLGGSHYNAGSGIALDSASDAYVTGWTDSADFPTTPRAFQTRFGGTVDAFVAELNASGSVVYSSYLGGSGNEGGLGTGGVAVDASSNAYITGSTYFGDFPTTPGAVQTTYGGGWDAFVAKIGSAADTAPPVTTATVSGPTGNDNWYLGAVTVTLSATDPDGAVAATYYSVDGGANRTYGASFSVAGDGVHQFLFYSVDFAGNEELAKTLSIKIDATPPIITGAAQPATLWPPNEQMSSISVSGAITDAMSGVNAGTATFEVTDEYGLIQPSGSVMLGTDGRYAFTVALQAARRGDDQDGRLYRVTVRAGDNAGNTNFTSTVVIVPHDQGE